MKGIEYELKVVDVMKGETETDEYLGKFPSGAVPAIEIDGMRLSEGAAILTYLAETRGWDDLYPSNDAAKRAKISQWLHWHHSGSRLATTHFFRPLFGVALGKVDGAAIVPAIAEAKKQFRDALLTMKFGALKDTPFLCGDAPTLADVLVYCEFDQLDMIGFLEEAGITPDFPEVAAWIERMKALPAHDAVRAPMPRVVEMLKPAVEKLRAAQKSS
eukprot:CAMPEP_0174853228 /NCGR_PEP_ID=MMETSP1114-20130205/27545_1 /TAXON_ID=312471 /ORGANISM="Neobodo designis, Strain CCAP 1951/1" /LENGTH=215 /DNA_ID=CAMNT_0016087851 /DNA_START=108 /DNA_END=755 /DNA_ORIENTATION=+